jgi:hypothetical protein
VSGAQPFFGCAPPAADLNPEEDFCYQRDRVVLFQTGFFMMRGRVAVFLQAKRIFGGSGLTRRFVSFFNRSVINGPRTV